MLNKFYGFLSIVCLKRRLCILFTLAILALLLDYYGGMILENYKDYNYHMSFIAFIVIIIIVIIFLYTLLFPSSDINEKSEDEKYVYFDTGYDNYLFDILRSSELNSIFINGPFGCGKTTMLEHALSNIGENVNYIKINLYGAKIENNLDFIYSELKNKEPKFIQILKNTITITLTSFLAFLAAIIGAMYTKSTEISIFVCIAILYTIVSAYIQYTKTSFYKENYVQNKINSLDYIIVDDLDRAYVDKTSIVSLIHIIYNYINESKDTKLILVGNRYTFLEKNNEKHSDQTHLLEKYYDFDFEFPIDIVRDQYIKSLIKNLPIVKYEVEQLSEIEPLLKSSSSRNILKTIRYIDFSLKLDSIIIKKLYLSDYLFISILYSKNKINVDDFLTKLDSRVLGFRWKRDFETVKKDFDDLIKDFEFSENEKKYLEKALKYTYEDVGSSFIQLGYYKYNNRLFNQPKYYKRNTYINNEMSPEERIEDITNKIKNEPEKISSLDMYYFDRSTIEKSEKDKIINQIIKMAELESSYESNLSRSIEHIIREEDERIGLNLKYNWLSKNGLDDSTSFNKIKKIITIENFKELSLVNRVNLLERALFNNDDRYLNTIPKSEYMIYIEKFDDLKRPYNVFKIFGDEIDGLKCELIKSLLKQYRKWLENIKENYNYYADDPYRGKRTDDGDKDLEGYNKFKAIACSMCDIDEEEFYFSFDD